MQAKGSSRRPKASSPDALRRMKQQKRRDTKPEISVRSALHRRGLRFRVDRKVIPALRRKADIVFGPAKVAVYIDGCFWHGCPEHGTWPKANAEWWRNKIETNKLRDRDTNRRLEDAGWCVLRFWAHEDPLRVAEQIEDVVRARRPSRK